MAMIFHDQIFVYDHTKRGPMNADILSRDVLIIS